MAKRFFWIGILVMVLVLGMLVAGCNMEPKGCDGDGICTSCFGSGVRTMAIPANLSAPQGGTYIGYWDNVYWYRFYGQGCGNCNGTGKCPICNGAGC